MHYAAITERLAHTGGAKWAIHQRCRTMNAAGADIIELTIGEPDQPPDPRLFEVCHASMLAGRTGYSNGRGEPELLEAIAARYSRRRAGVDSQNVLCFPGTQTALFATMMGLTGPGDGVLVGDPFYATYEGVIVASGAHRESVPLRSENGFRLTAEDLEASITPHSRVLLLNSPHNPTGAVLDAGELAQIGEVCRKHDLWIVADEVYEELVFDGNFASPFDNPELADRVIALSSISKSHAAPGFRSGWAVGPQEFCDKLLPLAETMLFGNQPFIADMTAFALNSDLPTSARMRASYKHRTTLFADTLEKIDGITPFRPQAGMFIVLDVSGTGLDGESFAWRLLEAGVAVMPGSSFGANAGALVRLSLTVPDESVVEACARIKRFVEGL
ncbi:MAG: pyridoxal phosphate-dependent aminotransferase [Hoeflea sp.]|uniref:pyridoxal phosphate-dependent aminotransferase n=1 Tax=Hoeflea sp. TaxID=1940281 RepID=UPI00329A36E2